MHTSAEQPAQVTRPVPATPSSRPIPVFYSEELNARADSYSPSASKPRLVLAAWQAERLPLRFAPIRPATETDLALAHDPAYVRGVLAGQLPNGFGNTSPDVARSLPWTTGAMLSAARQALATGIACAPVSGFHHAHYDSAGGFCTFNGLVVAAARLLAEARVHRVLVLDCDHHHGDGTESLLERLRLADRIENASFGRWYLKPQHAPAYLQRLRATAARFADFDLILYQAGADVHVDDPLGGVLTTEQMIERDHIIFEAARERGVPLAWNLAGGYQDPIARVIALHVNTMRECARAHATERRLAAGGSP